MQIPYVLFLQLDLFQVPTLSIIATYAEGITDVCPR